MATTKRYGPRHWLGVIAALLAAIAISGAAGVLIVNRFLLFTIEDVGAEHSALISTRFGRLPSVGIGEGPTTLMAAIVPGARSTEQSSIDWYGEPLHHAAQLTVLRFTVQAPIANVSDWYKKKLGHGFVMSTGWSDQGQSTQEEWMQNVHKAADSNALVFSQNLGSRIRGALLQMPSEDGNVRITLYDYHRSNN